MSVVTNHQYSILKNMPSFVGNVFKYIGCLPSRLSSNNRILLKIFLDVLLLPKRLLLKFQDFFFFFLLFCALNFQPISLLFNNVFIFMASTKPEVL